MIEFTEGYIPEKKLSTVTAYISQLELLAHGKNFATTVVTELVKQSVLVHRIEVENMVTEFIMSPDIKKYIEDKIKETIDSFIQKEVEGIFRKEI